MQKDRTSCDVIDFGEFRQSRRAAKPSSASISTIASLSDNLGPRYALLLHLMGFETLQDLGNSYPLKISGIPGIGEKRVHIIASVLADHDLANEAWLNELGRLDELKEG